MKLEVVGNEIPVSLRPDENPSPYAIPDANPGVNQEVGAVEMSAATAGGDCTAIKLVVENQCLPANARHKIAPGFFSQPGCVDAIDVVQDRAIGLEVVVDRVAVAEGPLGQYPEMIVRNVLDAETGIGSSFFRRRQKSYGSGWVLRGPECVAANGDIDFLSPCEGGNYDKSACERASYEPSQSVPLRA